MPLESGARLGHYEVISPIGAGGMGEVYKARDPRLNRTVAIKVLPAHITERAELRERFEREARAIAAFNHPHICVVHDVGRHDETDFLVMEYLEGETLGDRIAQGPLPVDQLVTYGIQIADALDRAHRHGVTHRDLKPGNIMIGEDDLILETPNNKAISDWSNDGRYILYDETDPRTKRDLWALPLSGDRKPIRVVATPADEYAAAFSPDGRWIAYVSDESGSQQVYVQGFPEPRGKWQISTGATAVFPRWSRDGKELFYDGAGDLMAAEVSGSGAEFRAGTPRELFNALRALGVHNFDISPDGHRFLVITEGLETRSAPVIVTLNWMSGIR